MRFPRIVLAVSLAVPFATAAAGFAYVRFAPVTGEQLSYSVRRNVGGLMVLQSEPCIEQQSRVWSCDVDDPEGSGNISTFTVRMRSTRCWRATRGPRRHGLPLKRQATGCVSLRDRVRLGDRL